MTAAGATGATSSSRGVLVRLGDFLRAMIDALRTVSLTALAAQVAYGLIFAMPSILLVIALVINLVDQGTGFAISDEARMLIIGALPPGVQPVVISLVDDAMLRAREGPSTLSGIVAILVALLMAGNGLGELATAFDRAAGIIDPRPAWQKRFIFTASALGIGLILFVAFGIYVWGGDAVGLLLQRLHLNSDMADRWLALYGPVILVLVFLGTTILYMTSSGRYCFRETAPGGLVATAIWLAIVRGFQVYLQVANPGTAYGAASSVLVFLIFLYLTSAGLIVGAMTAAIIVRGSRERGRMKLEAAAAVYGASSGAAEGAEREPGGRG